MKRFDEAAAKRGARVCTAQGQEVRILCYDLKHKLFPIVAAITDSDGTEWIRRYTIKGEFIDGDDGKEDLMMADDDYLEKLERGEYNHSGEATKKVDWAFLTSAFINVARAADDMSNRVKQLLEESKRAQDMIEERKKDKQ